MATIPTQSLTEPFHPYPDSADNTAPGATADAGEFFSTLLDIINPLQHIPLVSKLYREWTGDEINSTARMVGGGAVFGGPIGFAAATANVLLEQASGDDLLGHAVALLSDDAKPSGTDLADPNLLAARPPEKVAIPDATTDADTTTTLLPEAATAVSQPKSLEWLPDALSLAKQNATARAAGSPTPPATAQPWVANAMFDALDKYEALARARNLADSPKPDDRS